MFQITFSHYHNWLPGSKKTLQIQTDVEEARMTLCYLAGMFKYHVRDSALESFKAGTPMDKPEATVCTEALTYFLISWCEENSRDICSTEDNSLTAALLQAYKLKPKAFAQWFLAEYPPACLKAG